MSRKNGRVCFLAVMLILGLGGGICWVTKAAPTQGSAAAEDQHDRVLTYIRERFGLPPTEKLSLGAWHPSAAAPSFSESTVTADDGKNQRTNTVLVSKDSRFLIIVTGSIIDLTLGTPAEMVQRIHDAFKTPDTLKLSVGGFKPSPSPPFQEGTLNLDDGKTKQTRPLLLTNDRKHLILSELYTLGVDPRQKARANISLHDEPSIGPASAPVTIVEYADLQCPMCARMHDFLETKVAPRYGNKVRIIFKEFPLVGIHDWSYTAAIADQCAYEINPSSYVPLRSAIFRSQQIINITNLRDTLLNFGEQAGVDRVKLAGCLDAKASSPRIQRDMAEAKRIDVAQTPTVFINWRMMVGFPSEDAYYQAIDEALRGGK